MPDIIVKNQAELDAAVTDTKITLIYIESEGERLTLNVPRGREVRVVLRGNSRAELWENSHAPAPEPKKPRKNAKKASA